MWKVLPMFEYSRFLFIKPVVLASQSMSPFYILNFSIVIVVFFNVEFCKFPHNVSLIIDFFNNFVRFSLQYQGKNWDRTNLHR